MAKSVGAVIAAIVVLFVGMQLVPYGRNHTNPPVLQEPQWDSPQTRELVKRACFDCHSNETRWPWYSNLAPVSWLIQRDVDEGRQKLNFSEWNRPQEGAEDVIEVIRSGKMPPLLYTLMQPKARLSPAEKQALVEGLQRTFRQSGVPVGEGTEHGEGRDTDD